jgi:peptidyl-prolyl cis-trans isomerase D
MLASIREFAKSWPAKLLFVVLVMAFGSWGIQGAVHQKISTAVVTAGSREVSEARFRQLLDNYIKQVGEEQGQPPPMADLVKAGVPLQLAQYLAPQEALGAWLSQAGINPSDDIVSDHLHDDPNLRGAFNPVTGQFDQKAFLDILHQNKIDENDFRRQMKDAVAMAHLRAAILAGTRAPRLYGALEAEFRQETRDASLILLDPSTLGAPPTPTDADLRKFYADVSAQLKMPETRVLTIALFDPEKVIGSVTVDPAEVQRLLNLRKQGFTVPETRTFLEIATRDPQGILRAAAALKAGKSFEEAAAVSGGQLQPFKNVAKTAVPDAKVAERAFAMKPGQTDGPLRGDLSFALVRVEAITPPHEATLEDKRAQIEGELKKQAAKDKVADMIQKYTDAHDAGASLPDAARKVGAWVVTEPAMTRDGRVAQGGQLNVPKPVMDQAFTLAKNGEGDIQTLPGGVSFAVKVDAVNPPFQRKFDDVRPQLVQAWVAQETGRRLKARADALVARVKKGESLAAVAAAEHLQVKTLPNIPRPNGQAATPQAAVQAAVFAEPQGQAFAAPVSQSPPVMMIGEVTAIHAPDTAKAAEATEKMRPALTTALANDLADSTRFAARDRIKPTIDCRNAISATGVTPTEADCKTTTAK